MHEIKRWSTTTISTCAPTLCSSESAKLEFNEVLKECLHGMANFDTIILFHGFEVRDALEH